MNYQERKFGYCLVNWNIKNVYLETGQNLWTIMSPAFTIRGAVQTKWKMWLAGEDDEEPSVGLTKYADTTIRLSLENLNGDEVSSIDKVEVLLNLEMGSTVVNSSPMYKSFADLQSGFHYKLVEAEYITQQKHSDFHPDEINLKCLILVSFKNVVETFQPCRIENVKQLSDDLLELYIKRYESDIVIKVNAQKIKSHKCILHARSEFFAKKINENSDKSKITLKTGIDFESLKKIIAFIYSGNLEFVLKEPSIFIFKMADQFQLKEVLDYYRPDKLDLYTEISSKEFCFTWTIKNFFRKLDPHFETSFETEIDDISCILRLYPRDSRNSKYVTFFAEVVRGSPETSICFEFAVKYGKEHLVLEKIKKTFTGVTKFELMKIIRRSDLVKLSNNGDLILGIKLRINDGSYENRLGKSEGYCIDSKENSYDNLCMDMKLMYLETIFKDAIIHSKTGRAKANKCVIAVRYPRLYERLSGRNFVKLGIDDDLLDELLHYLYSGSYKHAGPPSRNVLEGISMLQEILLTQTSDQTNSDSSETI